MTTINHSNLEQRVALKAFELLAAIKSGVLVTSANLTPAQLREVRRELALIDIDVTEFMKDHEGYFASVHLAPPVEDSFDDEFDPPTTGDAA